MATRTKKQRKEKFSRYDTADYLQSVGAKPFPAGPDELKAFEDADTRRWAEIVEIAKIEKK